ncbi:MAG TPA: DUF3144 domain-containing protein [Cyclobacteriaceae bacterium]|nr:DUF3144 domain-containing protein [Cyclobacteriaceae bacterium]
MNKLDSDFFNRADEHIQLSNDQMLKVSMGKVSSSMMYSVARFNAYVFAHKCNSVEEMKRARQETIDFFVAEYEMMLKENLDDYIKNFNKYKS